MMIFLASPHFHSENLSKGGIEINGASASENNPRSFSPSAEIPKALFALSAMAKVHICVRFIMTPIRACLFALAAKADVSLIISLIKSMAICIITFAVCCCDHGSQQQQQRIGVKFGRCDMTMTATAPQIADHYVWP